MGSTKGRRPRSRSTRTFRREAAVTCRRAPSPELGQLVRRTGRLPSRRRRGSPAICESNVGSAPARRRNRWLSWVTTQTSRSSPATRKSTSAVPGGRSAAQSEPFANSPWRHRACRRALQRALSRVANPLSGRPRSSACRLVNSTTASQRRSRASRRSAAGTCEIRSDRSASARSKSDRAASVWPSRRSARASSSRALASCVGVAAVARSERTLFEWETDARASWSTCASARANCRSASSRPRSAGSEIRSISASISSRSRNAPSRSPSVNRSLASSVPANTAGRRSSDRRATSEAASINTFAAQGSPRASLSSPAP